MEHKRILPWAYLFPNQWKLLKVAPEIRWHIHASKRETIKLWLCRTALFLPLAVPVIVYVVFGLIAEGAKKVADFISGLQPDDIRGDLVKDAWKVLPLEEIKARLSPTPPEQTP